MQKKNDGVTRPKTKQADFDRNRDGLYGGLPKARDPKAEGPAAKDPHPPR